MTSVLFTMFLALAWATPINITSPSNTTQSLHCPLYLPRGSFEFPHLIVPISQVSPGASLGNSFTPAISPNDFATISNFDIPASRAGQTCSLYFSFPLQSQLVTTRFTYWGAGTFDFVQYRDNSGATPRTTWNTQPLVSNVLPIRLTQVAPGDSFKIWTGSCPGGLFSWRMSSVDSCLWYFQDFNDCAIGLYVIYG